MELTPDEEYVVTCGIDGTMFILKLEEIDKEFFETRKSAKEEEK
eukprot:CAMPEP_0114576400 /NCGR_PEP_ID=MMETSP0125-20121206/1173_1 /TAXON_ID=485358 ORGANISM="Aristerostoma sp., Strain ATCC 50986" /NCGR_SAMPLE_ID=MMETSP0125 /ASSEMBLY_ACC=CAM_ASM_000245 /LENGTH=43 /DNA_ID= /DNA_START= /DNA_END= /DNA_ORIENTATION=